MEGPCPKTLLADTRWLRRLTRVLVHDPALADDLCQETLVAALHRPAGGGRSWLARVARNLAVSFLRRDTRRRRVESAAAAAPGDAEPPASEVVAEGELQRAAVDALMELEEPYRTTLLLRFMKGLTRREVARLLGVPVDTVRTRQKRGLALLRGRLKHRADVRCALVSLLAVPGWPRPTTAALWGILMMKTKVGIVSAAALLLTVSMGWYTLHAGPNQEPATSGAPVDLSANEGREESETPSTEQRSEVRARTERENPAPRKEKEQAPRPGHLLVRVLRNDDEKTPVEKVGVLLHVGHRTAPRVERTGDDGTVYFHDVAPGKVRVEVDRKPTVLEAEILPGERTTLTARVWGVDLHGRVLDRHGQPVANATVLTVWMTRRPKRPVPVATTNSRGQFFLRAVSILNMVGAASRGLGTSNFALANELKVDERTAVVELVLPGGSGALRGVVRDVAGQAIAHAWVRVGLQQRYLKKDGPAKKEEVHWFSPPPAQVSTDERGRFEAHGLRPGTLPVQVYAKGYALWRGEVECPSLATPELAVWLKRGGSLTGKVVDTSGKAIADAEVEIPSLVHPAVARATSDDKGEFRIDDVPAEEVTIEIDGGKHGATQRKIIVPAGQVQHQDFRLGTGPALRGVLRDVRGRPLTGWVVKRATALNEKIETNARGEFVILDCEQRAHEIEVQDRKSGCLVTVLHEVHPSDEEKIYRIEESKMPSCTVRGRVLDARGTPIEGASVVVWQNDIVPAVVVFTDARGRFTTMKLPPGRYQLEFVHEGFKQGKREEVTLTRGQRRELEDVRLARSRC